MTTRTIAAATFVFAWLALSLPAPAVAAGTATASSPVRISVPVPQAAKNAGVAMLELVVRARGTGDLGGVVRIGHGGNAVEVGRFSIGAAGGEQRFQFNATLALRHLDLSGRSAMVEVAIVERSGGQIPSGAALVVGSARIAVR
jgi:hypothetical protein